MFNETIISITRGQLFTDVWGIPPYTKSNKGDYYDNPKRQKNALYKTMGDCQIVLRFFALLDPEKIKGSMQKILNNCSKENMVLSPTQCEKLIDLYIECLSAAVVVRGKNPFDINSSAGHVKRSVPFQDALMCSLGRLSDEERKVVMDNHQLANQAIQALTNDEDKYDLLVGRANTSEDTKKRIDAVSEAIRSAL